MDSIDYVQNLANFQLKQLVQLVVSRAIEPNAYLTTFRLFWPSQNPYTCKLK